MVKKFEYKQVIMGRSDHFARNTNSTMADLQALGKDGWELVSSIDVGPHQIRHFFKREVVEQADVWRDGQKIASSVRRADTMIPLNTNRNVFQPVSIPEYQTLFLVDTISDFDKVRSIYGRDLVESCDIWLATGDVSKIQGRRLKRVYAMATTVGSDAYHAAVQCLQPGPGDNQPIILDWDSKHHQDHKKVEKTDLILARIKSLSDIMRVSVDEKEVWFGITLKKILNGEPS